MEVVTMVIIDFSKFRLRSIYNGRRIERCPKCSKKGLASHYSGGTSLYAHTAKVEMGCLTIQNSCDVKGKK